MLSYFPYPPCFSFHNNAATYLCVNIVFSYKYVYQHLFFSNKVDLSQVTSVVIPRKRLCWNVCPNTVKPVYNIKSQLSSNCDEKCLNEKHTISSFACLFFYNHCLLRFGFLCFCQNFGKTFLSDEGICCKFFVNFSISELICIWKSLNFHLSLSRPMFWIVNECNLADVKLLKKKRWGWK